jgi:hypothetical protein
MEEEASVACSKAKKYDSITEHIRRDLAKPRNLKSTKTIVRDEIQTQDLAINL